MENTILFCCTGNYYRSRFAEIYFNYQANERSLNWDAFSRGLGLSSVNKGPISSFTLDALKIRAIPIPQDYGSPVQLSLDDLKRANRIIAIKRTEHLPMMEAQFPQFLNKTEFWEIHDIDVEKPESAIPKLEEKLDGLLLELSKKD